MGVDMGICKRVHRRVVRLFHPVVGEIWCLHRVVPERSWARENRELEITPAYLEQLIVDYRRRGYRFVSLDEFEARRNRFRMPWQKKMVVVSFDDGFRDVYEYAYPIFQQYGVPFTVYLTTSFPDGQADLWWLHLERLLEARPDREVAYTEAIRDIYASEGTPSQTFAARYTPLADWDARQYMLTWEMLREMQSSGLLTVGSHTVTHPMLARVPMAQVEEELRFSRERIGEMMGVVPRHFSYPHSSMTEEVAAAVARAGYSTATLGYGGSVRRGNTPYWWNRVYLCMDV